MFISTFICVVLLIIWAGVNGEHAAVVGSTATGILILMYLFYRCIYLHRKSRGNKPIRSMRRSLERGQERNDMFSAFLRKEGFIEEVVLTCYSMVNSNLDVIIYINRGDRKIHYGSLKNIKPRNYEFYLENPEFTKNMSLFLNYQCDSLEYNDKLISHATQCYADYSDSVDEAVREMLISYNYIFCSLLAIDVSQKSDYSIYGCVIVIGWIMVMIKKLLNSLG